MNREIATQADEHRQQNAALTSEQEGGRKQRHADHGWGGAPDHGEAGRELAVFCFLRMVLDSSHEAQARALPNSENALIIKVKNAASLISFSLFLQFLQSACERALISINPAPCGSLKQRREKFIKWRDHELFKTRARLVRIAHVAFSRGWRISLGRTHHSSD